MYDLFDQPELPFTAPQLRNAGMKMALESADTRQEGWGDKCYGLLKEYLKINSTPFLAEYFRGWCESGGRISEPPSRRAYGSIMARAARDGLIKRQGYANTSNPKAHCSLATVWIKTDNK